MIHTSRQLKALVRNISKGDSMQAQILIRNYIMERFLERLALSPYRENFILKGGMLVSAMVGLDARSTMDIDTTIKNLPLNVESVESILAEIISVQIEDDVIFKIERISEIMDEADYDGIRASMTATIDTMKTPMKLDIGGITGKPNRSRHKKGSFPYLSISAQPWNNMTKGIISSAMEDRAVRVGEFRMPPVCLHWDGK